jgi:hypothetical protein
VAAKGAALGLRDQRRELDVGVDKGEERFEVGPVERVECAPRQFLVRGDQSSERPVIRS